MKFFFHSLSGFLLIISSVIGLTALMLLMTDASLADVIYHLYKGSAGSWFKLARVIAAWMPLTLCACGLIFTFRIGLWNIGVEGQMIMGAVAATWVIRFGISTPSLPGILPLAFLAGLTGGALWAVLAGFLKTRGSVNEIFAGLGLNFVAQGAGLWLIFGPWKRPGIASMSGTEIFPRELWLPKIAGLRLSPPGLLLVFTALAVTLILMQYTRIGLHLKAVGSSAKAARLLGLRPERNMLLAMSFAGGFAGLAGCLQVTGVYHRLIPSISSGYGYLALLVVMLAGYRVWLSAGVALFFAALNAGSIQLPMMLQLDSSLSGVIQGMLVLGALGFQAWKGRSS